MKYHTVLRKRGGALISLHRQAGEVNNNALGHGPMPWDSTAWDKSVPL